MQKHRASGMAFFSLLPRLRFTSANLGTLLLDTSVLQQWSAWL
jgi:hypothetical protein